jgi:lipoprotein-releasing system permease protein
MPDKTFPIILGKGLTKLLNVSIGDKISLIAPRDDTEQMFNDSLEFKVTGIYDSGLSHYDNKIGLTDLKAAALLFGMEDNVTGIELGLKKPENSFETAELLRAKLQFSVKDWQSFNHNIFEAMKSEKAIIGIIVFLVAFVASFNILSTLFVSVSQKQRDISILKALGATHAQIIYIFLKQSLLMGITGTFIGVGLALGLSTFLKEYPIIELPDIYMLKSLPVVFDPFIYMGVAGIGFLIAILAGLYPAFYASRTHPMDGLRKTHAFNN